MDFFEELGKKASKTYQVAAEKTGKLSRVAKLKMQMSQDKDKIEELYEEIGKRIYENHVREEKQDLQEEMDELCSEIDVFSDEIESARMEILSLKDKRQCKSCYTEIELDFHYCPNCGEKQEIEEDTQSILQEEPKENEQVSQTETQEKSTIQDDD